jgi:FkbM family methyltransferase
VSHWKYGFQTHELREAFLIRNYGLGPAEHDYLKHYLLKPGDIFVEAGAYIGRTGFLAQAMGARAILIEASPEHIEVIKKSMRIRGLNAILVTKALWSEEGYGYYTTNGGSGNRLTKDFRSSEYLFEMNPVPENTIGVYTTTLPQILKDFKIDRVNLFACDIEGAEVEVVKTLDANVELNVAIASYHLGSLENVEKQIMKPLEAKGYHDVSYEEGLVFGTAE